MGRSASERHHGRVQTALSAQPRAFARRWISAWSSLAFRWSFLLALAALIGSLALLSQVLRAAELRPGAVLEDPLLARFAARDLSVLSFTVIYGGLLAALLDLLGHPRHLLRGLVAYTLVALGRAATVWVTPLDPPRTMVTLRDPLIETFGPAQLLTRDLFFSGHTATLFLMALCVPSRWLRSLLFPATAVVAVLVLLQHAHYTVDVLVAPCMAFCAFRLAAFASERVSG
jgi:hypothetical protein